MANKNNPFSSYYNYPKAWGEAPAEERWHSDPSEQGITPPWIKDAFGFGTERPAPQLSEIDEKVKNAYEIKNHEDLEKLLISDIGEENYVNAAIKFERDGIKKMLEHDELDLGGNFDVFKNLQRKSITKRYNKSYDELYNIYSKAYQKAQKHRKENTNAIQRFAEEQTNIPYTNMWSGKKEIQTL